MARHSTPHATRACKPARGACLLALALALAGCLGSYEEAVEETRAGLIGKTGRELRACFGVPADFDREGSEEHVTYRWFDKPRPQNGSPVTGGIVLGPTGRGTMGGPGSVDLPSDPDQQGFCRLEFVLGANGVSKVTAIGRDEHGLRADAECMLRARHCVDGDDADE